MIILRELTAASLILGPFLDSTDGVTAKTSLVLSNGTTRISKNGGAFAARNASDSAVHKENGYYGLNLSVTDLNTVGNLVIAAVTTATLPVWLEIMVMASPVYDSLILGSDRLQVDVEEMANNIITSSVIAADAIGSSELAQSAVDEIVDAVWDELASGHTTTGTFGKFLDTQLSIIAAYIDTEVAAIKAKTDQLTFTAANKVDAQSQLSTQGKADVNAEVVDALNVDTYAELSALPSASPTIKEILMFLFEIARNKLTTTATEQKLYKDNGTTVLGTWTVSDDGTTFTKSEIV